VECRFRGSLRGAAVKRLWYLYLACGVWCFVTLLSFITWLSPEEGPLDE
jgi:hypothetical protein